MAINTLQIFLIVTTITAAICLIRYFTRDYRKFFIRTKGSIVNITSEPIAENSSFKTEHFQIETSGGFKLNGYLKIPVQTTGKYPMFIILGGLFTGKDVIGLVDDIPDTEPVITLSIDYPYEGEKRLSWYKLILALPAIRRAALNCVRGILLSVDMLSNRKEVNPDRIYLVGISFGAFFGMAAAACDSRIKSVASLYGGGKIDKLATVNLPFKLGVINNLIGKIAQWIALPVEPLQYAKYISPRPLLVVGGSDDEKFPRDCAQSLYDCAGNPKDILWFESKHVEPEKNDLTLELTRTVVNWMKKRGILKPE